MKAKVVKHLNILKRGLNDKERTVKSFVVTSSPAIHFYRFCHAAGRATARDCPLQKTIPFLSGLFWMVLTRIVIIPNEINENQKSILKKVSEELIFCLNYKSKENI